MTTEFNANDAKNLVKSFIECLTGTNANTYNRIIECIKKEATEGKTSCHYYSDINHCVREKLESNGFVVLIQYDGRNEDNHQISWNSYE